MAKLGRIAETYGCAVVLIGHMNKASGQKCAYRGLGSIDIPAVARSLLIVGKLKNEPSKRVMSHAKSSLAQNGQSLVFQINEHSGLEWCGTIDLTADQFLEDGGTSVSKLESAKQFLLDILADGAKSQNEIQSAAEEMEFGIRTRKSAKTALGVKSIKVGEGWLWQLPEV